VGWKRVALVGGVGFLVVVVLWTAFSGGDGDRGTYPDPSLSPGRLAAPRGRAQMEACMQLRTARHTCWH
jgi:hypothetical protein